MRCGSELIDHCVNHPLSAGIATVGRSAPEGISEKEGIVNLLLPLSAGIGDWLPSQAQCSNVTVSQLPDVVVHGAQSSAAYAYQHVPQHGHQIRQSSQGASQNSQTGRLKCPAFVAAHNKRLASVVEAESWAKMSMVRHQCHHPHACSMPNYKVCWI